jgi:integrase
VDTAACQEARAVRLPRSLAEELGAYLAGRPTDREALVFTAPRGGPLRESKFVRDRFEPAIAATNQAIGQLGHATASITLDTYGHLFPDELKGLAGRLEDARAEALAGLGRTQRGPAVVPLRKGAAQ